MIPKDELVIGLFYEDDSGNILRTFGCNGPDNEILYYYNDDFGRRTIAEAEALKSWTKRHDINDFPDTKDPRVPSSFDLIWDVKTRSGLVQLLISKEDEAEVRKMMEDYNVILTDDELEAVSGGNYFYSMGI